MRTALDSIIAPEVMGKACGEKTELRLMRFD